MAKLMQTYKFVTRNPINGKKQQYLEQISNILVYLKLALVTLMLILGMVVMDESKSEAFYNGPVVNYVGLTSFLK